MNISLKSKRALVGGSSKGLGYAVAKQLAKSGARVTLVARDEKRLLEIVKELNFETGLKHNYLVVDYNDFDNYQIKIKKYLSTNKIDILVNNTQGPKPGDVSSVSIEDYQKSFDLLFKSVVYTTMLVLENMKKNSWGRIINMTSVSVKEPLSYLALSNTIRSAVSSWGKSLSNDVGIYNITVNNILTGFFNTERINEINSLKAKELSIKIEEIFDAMKNLVPLKRIGEPNELGYLVTFLASNNAAYINGSNIPIDGGVLKSY
ncbi:MAG: SDR family oxidoreductase [Flavobacteriales bacterium]|mgnify:CR=1 FL=1|jgi:3-oxoacyl-[acyl-carrier protein] reductase|tara:strand:+ start:4384 stop:5169 length:786 start_codon:yes stop_codon:yes gene_type:complete